MLPPAAVVFDLDGTLIDSRGDIVAAVNHALGAIGRPPQPGSLIVRWVGDGARALCARAAHLPETTDEIDRMVEAFITYYTEHPIAFTRFLHGAHEALDALSDMPDVALAICTNKPRATTEAVLGALGIRTRFRTICAGGDVSEKKPAPGPLLYIARQLGLSVDSLVMVGDGPQDIECARHAGCRAIAVESPFHPRDRVLAVRPDLFLTDLLALPDIIRRWRDATARIAIKRPA